MRSQILRIQWRCFFLLFFFVVSCSLNLELKKPKGEREFFQEASRLEKLAREDPATSVRAKSHRQLAFLYVNSRNPQFNYSRALQEMESYLSMSPAKAQKDDFQNWFAVLKELDRVRKGKKGMEEENLDLQTQIEQLRISVRKDKKTMEEKNLDLQTQIGKLRISLEKVQEANKNLRDEVANLQEMIEKLNDIDYQIEEKRKFIK